MDEFSTCVAFKNITGADSAVSVFVMYSDSDTLGFAGSEVHTVCSLSILYVYSYKVLFFLQLLL